VSRFFVAQKQCATTKTLVIVGQPDISSQQIPKSFDMARGNRMFVVQTPVRRLMTVTLWSGTWSDHIIQGHPEMLGKAPMVKQALEDPLHVVDVNVPNRFVFVSAREVNHTGCPLIVAVSTADSSGFPVVASAYYGNKRYLDKTRVSLIWP
jgi:hypothetical protein